MNKTDLYREGARLPEQLSRLLFLEGVIAGRRVLEVGCRSPGVARFLLALGAQRVVCAVEDRDLLETLRDQNDVDAVDYRAVRPAGGSRPPGVTNAPVLPGDDGAFDLVVDFSLPEALGAGRTERLTDIKRLLSEDGFALTSLTTNARGLGAVVDDDVVAVPRLAYRPLVDALQGEFELTQVYFQSLLLGYLFGSFDVEPNGEGIAPQTSLMGDTAEPAGAYLFAFGNAIPVIEDVCLVQVPFDALLDAVSQRRQERAALASSEGHERGHEGHGAADFGDSTDVGVPSHHHISAQRYEAAPLVDALSGEGGEGGEGGEADGDDQRDDLSDLQAAARSLEEQAGLVRELDDAAGRVVDLERAMALAGTELARVQAARDALRHERDGLAEQLVAADRERGELSRNGRTLADEIAVMQLRVDELEASLVALDGEKGELQRALLDEKSAREAELHRANTEREVLEATAAANDTVITELELALEAAGVPIGALRTELTNASDDRDARDARDARDENDRNTDADRDVSTVAARLRHNISERFAAVEARAVEAEGAISERDDRLSALGLELREARALVASLQASLQAFDSDTNEDDNDNDNDADDDLARETSNDLLDLEVLAIHEELARRRHESHRLAVAVLALGEERSRLVDQARAVVENLRRRLAQEEQLRESADARAQAALSQVDGAAAEILSLRHAIDEAAAARDEANARLEHLASEHGTVLEAKRRDLRQLEETRRLLSSAQDLETELRAQRSVLEGALNERERSLRAADDDASDLRAEIERLGSLHEATGQREEDLRRAAEALSLEVRRLQGVVEEQGQALATLQEAAKVQQARADDAEAKRASAEDEAISLMEDGERQLQAAVDALKEEHNANVASITALMQTSLDEARQALQATLEAAAASEAVHKTALAREQEAHESTRDELAHLTATMLELETEVEAERTRLQGALAQRDDAVEKATAAAAAAAASLAAAHEENTQLTSTLAAQRLATEDELHQAQANVERHEGELIRLQGALDVERAARQKAEHDRDGVDNARTILTIALDEAKTELLSLKASLDDLKAATARSEDEARRQVADVVARAEALEAAKTAAVADLALLGDEARLKTEALRAVEEARDVAVAEVERLTNAVAEISAERDQALADVTQRDAAVDEQSAEAARLVADKEARFAAELAALQTALDDAEAKVAQQQAALDERNAAVDDASARLASLEAELAATAAARDTLAESRTQLAIEHESLSGERDGLHTELAALREQHATLEATWVELDDSHGKATRAHEALEEERRSLASALDEAQAACNQFRQRADDVDAERNALQARLDEAVEALRVASDEARTAAAAQAATLTSVTAALEAAEAEAAKWASRLAALENTLEEERSARRQERQESDSAMARGQDVLDSARARHAVEVEALAAELATLQATAAQRASAVDDANARIEELQRDLDTARRDVDEAQRTHEEQNQAALNASLEAARLLHEAQEEVRAHEESLERVQQRLQQRLDDVEKEHAQTLAALETAKAEADVARAAGAEAMAEAIAEATAEAEAKAEAALAARAEQLEAAKAVVEGALEEAQAQLGKERARGDLFGEDLAEARDQLSAERSRGDLFAAQLEEARTSATTLQDRVRALIEERQELQESLSTLGADAAAEQEAADALRRELAQRDDVDGAAREQQERTIRDLEVAVEQHTARGDALAAQLEELQARAVTEKARGDVFAAQLQEAQRAAATERVRADVLEALLDDARDVWQQAQGALHAAREQADIARRDAQEARQAKEASEAKVADRAARGPEHDDVLRAAIERANVLGAELESRDVQMAGLKDALLTAREDHAEMEERLGTIEGAYGEMEQLMAANRAAVDDAAQRVAQANEVEQHLCAERDTALMAAEESDRRLQMLEDEIAGLRLEHERALAQAREVQSAKNLNSDNAVLREKLEALDRESRTKDEKIEEQQDRINRLTERIVRTEGFSG